MSLCTSETYKKDTLPLGGSQALAVSKIIAKLFQLLGDKGYIFSGGLGLITSKEPAETITCPIAFYLKDRLKEIPEGYLREPPDVVIEVVTKETSLTGFEEKLKNYLDFNVGRVIFVDISRRIVTVVDGARRISLVDFDRPVEVHPEVFINLGEVLEGV